MSAVLEAGGALTPILPRRGDSGRVSVSAKRQSGGLERTGELMRRDSGSWKVGRMSKNTHTSKTKPHAKTFSHNDMHNVAVSSTYAEKQA